MRSASAASPRLWAIGGGKGGVGKTVVASSLAVAFAQRGRRCVLVDADLGGANLHTVLGVPRPPATLSSFLQGRVARLEDVACPTPVPGLRLVSGADAVFDAANPHHARKQKLLRHLSRLDADEVFVDLSAGSSFNVVDFFLAAPRGLLVVTPEPTSIENAYHFLKAAWFRALRGAAQEPQVRKIVQDVLARRSRPKLPLALIADVACADAEAGRLLAERAQSFGPGLLVNQAASPQDRRLGERIAEDCRNRFGAALEPLGALERDEAVRSAVARGRPVLDLFPNCAFADDLEGLVERLLPPPEPGADLASFALPEDLSQPGAILRRRREQLGLALPTLRRRTRIRGLEWLESERFDQLPAEPYVRSFVVQYARELGIDDADALARSYLARFRASRPATHPV
jgi:flagellar biosynthesis protein FlhG